MVARTPPKKQQHKIKMVAPLNPTLLRETANKVDKCMARLEELQYTVTGGNKVVSGVTLSPRSTRGYLRASLRCKQESFRNKNANNNGGRSPPEKLPTNKGGDWRRMSLPAMLLGETVGEILEASQFARVMVEAVTTVGGVGGKLKLAASSSLDDPKTPMTQSRRRPSPEQSELRSRRKREKQIARSESDRTPPPVLQRAKSRINFKVSSSPPVVVVLVHKREQQQQQLEPPEHNKENCSSNSKYYMANRVSPRHRPWAKKTVLFPNPLFHSSSSPTNTTSQKNQMFARTKSPVIARKHPTPHKFLIKSPVKVRNPKYTTNISSSSSSYSAAAKLRRSFSPSRLANRLISPLKSRKSVHKSEEDMMRMMSGLKRRPNPTPMRFSAPRI